MNEHDPLEGVPDGGCPGCGNWPEHCVCAAAIAAAHAAGHAPFGCPYVDDQVEDCSLYRRAKAMHS